MYGTDPRTGERPVYMRDEDDDKILLPDSPLSNSLRLWLSSTALRIDSAAALRATSPQLEAMIERAWILGNLGKCGDDEKETAAEYFATLSTIKEKAYAERDAKKKAEVANG